MHHFVKCEVLLPSSSGCNSKSYRSRLTMEVPDPPKLHEFLLAYAVSHATVSVNLARWYNTSEYLTLPVLPTAHTFSLTLWAFSPRMISTHKRHERSGVLLEKLTVTQIIKMFPAFYATRRFITLFTIARHLSLSWARWNQFTHSYPVIHLNIILPSTPKSWGATAQSV
jgi:hypothetical protein